MIGVLVRGGSSVVARAVMIALYRHAISLRRQRKFTRRDELSPSRIPSFRNRSMQAHLRVGSRAVIRITTALTLGHFESCKIRGVKAFEA
jgi:hypothetical protein